MEVYIQATEDALCIQNLSVDLKKENFVNDLLFRIHLV
jgi:hypothetical protein